MEYDQNSGVRLNIIDGNIAVLRIQDEPGENRFTDSTVQALAAGFDEAGAAKAVKAIVMTGADENFFMDTRSAGDYGNGDHDRELFEKILNAKVPVIAAMGGCASGSGFAAGLFADIIIVASESQYSFDYIKRGIEPETAAVNILKEKFGTNLSNQLMLTAVAYTGESLKSLNASVMVTGRSEVLPTAVRIAKIIAEKPRLTLTVLKGEFAKRLETESVNPAGRPGADSNAGRPSDVQAEETEADGENQSDFLTRLLFDLEAGKITPEQAYMLKRSIENRG